MKKIIDMIEVAVKENLPALLIGETGTGKTTMIRELAKEKKRELVRFTLTGETSVDDFVGRFELEDSKTVWRDGVLLQALKKGQWLVVDELNAALPEILFALHSLLDDDRFVVVAQHEGEIVKPHEDFRFFGTMNPPEEYVGTKELNRAFLSRFPLVVHVPVPGRVEEAEIIERRSGVKKEHAVKLALLAEGLRHKRREKQILYFTSTRDVIQAGALIKAGMPFETALDVAIASKAVEEREEVLKQMEAVNKGITKGILKDFALLDPRDVLKERKKLQEEKTAWEKDKRAITEKIISETMMKVIGKAVT